MSLFILLSVCFVLLALAAHDASQPRTLVVTGMKPTQKPGSCKVLGSESVGVLGTARRQLFRADASKLGVRQVAGVTIVHRGVLNTAWLQLSGMLSKA